MIASKMKAIFDKIVDVVFAGILAFIVIGMILGVLQLIFSTWKLLSFEGITGHYIDIIADVLTLYVLIELSRSLVEYFNTRKIRLTFILDAAIVFVIREILIALFKHEMEANMLYAYSAFLFVLGALRIASVLVNQCERRLPREEVQ